MPQGHAQKESTWLVQLVSYNGKEVWGECTTVADNLMAAKASAIRVFDYRNQKSGLIVAEHLIPGKNDSPGYIIDATEAIREWERFCKENGITEGEE